MSCDRHGHVFEDRCPSGRFARCLGGVNVALTRSTRSLHVLHSKPLPAELVAADDPAPDEAAPDEPVVAELAFESVRTHLEALSQASRSDHLHEQLRYGLIADLFGARLVPQESQIVDIRCAGPSGVVTYEVLGEGGHHYARMREAVLSLKEAEAVGHEAADHRFLVIPQPPAEPWSVQLLERAFGVSVIWRTTTGWDGPRVALALGTNT